MATTPTVLGNSPLEYTDPNSGKQISIPLSALFFDPQKNNQLSIDSTKWPDPSGTPVTLPPFVVSLLKDLVLQQLIVPAPSPAPKQAMIVTASDAGSAGNSITIAVAITTPNADPTQVIFSAAVTETDNYKGLSLTPAAPTYIEKVLGSDTVPSPSPGLVHVVHSSLGPTGKPANVAAFKATPPTSKARADVTDATPTKLFTLEAKKVGKDGEATTASAVPNAGDPTLLDLSVQWTKTATNLTLATMQAGIASALGYEIAVSPPPGGIFSVPSVGTVQLTGGADGTSPTAASAIVFAAQ